MESRINLIIVTIAAMTLLSRGTGKDLNRGLISHSTCSATHSFIQNDTIKAPILFIKNGINYVDLNGDGIDDMVISGYRNNITAHTFSYYTFYIFQKDLTEGNTPWGIVEINGENNFSISTYEGADGYLSDIAFVKSNGGKYELVKADRDFGNSFADSGRVKFSYFALKYDSIENRYLYEIKSSEYSKFKYIDVHEAISRELR